MTNVISDIKILIACEESQRITIEMRSLGYECYSCDTQAPSGDHPEWHIQQDVTNLVNGDCEFTTLDNIKHQIEGQWDLIIAHPPCTYLTNSGNKHFNVETYGEKAIQRMRKREEAYNFFMIFVNANCQHIAIENPVGYMSTHYRKPDQIIQPYYFGEPEQKTTCLWLKNLPKLQPTNIVEPQKILLGNGELYSKINVDTFYLPKKERAKARSKTFVGVAKAIAEQWGTYVAENA